MPSDLIDISIPLTDGMIHWPGDPPASFKRVATIGQNSPCNLTAANLGVHTGTHMDAPRHFISQGKTIDELPFDAVIGRAKVIACAGDERVLVSDLEPHDIKAGDRILFRTKNSDKQWWTLPFDESYVAISHEAARYLAERHVKTVGIDYLSIGKFGDEGVGLHHILLGAGIWAIEGLNLCEIQPGDYDMICLPLKIVGADGAPARVLLRPMQR